MRDCGLYHGEKCVDCIHAVDVRSASRIVGPGAALIKSEYECRFNPPGVITFASPDGMIQGATYYLPIRPDLPACSHFAAKAEALGE